MLVHQRVFSIALNYQRVLALPWVLPYVNGGVTMKMQFLLPSEMIICAIKNTFFVF